MRQLVMAVAFSICACSVETVWSAELQVGLATADITPPAGYRMSGYFNERLNTGTHDPLMARALVLRQGDQRLAVVCTDLIGLSHTVTQQARQAAAEQAGIPHAHILICASHSHTGPLYNGVLRQFFHDEAVKKHGQDPHEAKEYSAILQAKLTEVIVTAARQLKPAKLQAGIATQQGLSFNRRFHMKDGSVRFNPGKLNPDIVRVAGPIDPQVSLLSVVDDKNHRLGVLTVFALHLDTVGGTEYSADYPFYLERSLQQALGSDCVSMFGAGTCGDINHIDVTNMNRQSGHTETARIGTTLAKTVADAVPNLPEVTEPRLGGRSRIVTVPRQTVAPEELAQAKLDMFKIGTSELPFLKQVEAVKRVALGTLETTIPLEVQAFRVSPDVAIVGLPGEVFVELGLAIKAASPFKTTIVIELCNDAPAYIPTKKAFAEGSYETVNSLIQPGGGEQLVETAIALLKDSTLR